MEGGILVGSCDRVEGPVASQWCCGGVCEGVLCRVGCGNRREVPNGSAAAVVGCDAPRDSG